ncbi:pyridoxamine 5'-phosphate oxidase family protein, partial [Mycobacterium avium]|uniref:pyridoxamine 5'-phosphate oxidase family protein n=1 Tax=Mycobacterium avium TaxID=1764 RepID=UPI001F27BB1F
AAAAAGAGLPVCVTVTLVDALVLARAAMHHSVNFRSVVVLGDARVVDDPAEKSRALSSLLDHIAPGRRGPGSRRRARARCDRAGCSAPV